MQDKQNQSDYKVEKHHIQIINMLQSQL